MALPRRVLGEDQVAGPAHDSLAVARLELEDPRCEEDELAPRRVVVILHVPLRRLAEEHRSALEGLRRGPGVAAHRDAADLDRRFPRVAGEDAYEPHQGSLKCLDSAMPWRWYEDFNPAP